MQNAYILSPPTQHKCTLYLFFLRSCVIYPLYTHPIKIIHIQTADSTNKAIRFITNTHRSDFPSSQTLHEQGDIPAINAFLQQARKSSPTVVLFSLSLSGHFAPPLVLFHSFLVAPQSIKEQTLPKPGIIKAYIYVFAG
jgi:hypothetical protein